MRELRIQSQSKLICVLYVFDPRRTAILLIGKNKQGDEIWYEVYIPIADKLYQKHLEKLKKEKML